MSFFDVASVDFTSIMVCVDPIHQRLVPGRAVTLMHGQHMIFNGRFVREVGLTRQGSIVELCGTIPNDGPRDVRVWVYFPYVKYKPTWAERRSRAWLTITGRLPTQPIHVKPTGKSFI